MCSSPIHAALWMTARDLEDAAGDRSPGKRTAAVISARIAGHSTKAIAAMSGLSVSQVNRIIRADAERARSRASHPAARHARASMTPVFRALAESREPLSARLSADTPRMGW